MPGTPVAAGPVSVITVNFNAGAHLLECVRSVLAAGAAEVIVVDNGSTDGSMAALRAGLGADPRVRLLDNRANLGFARANNQALPFATGDYFLFLNPDCVVPPTALARMREVMEQHPGTGMAGCLLVNPDGTEQAGCRRELPTLSTAFTRALGLSGLSPRGRGRFRDYVLRDEPLPDGPAEVEAISGAFMFVRRTALREVGPLDEAYFLHCEDLDWCMRFRQRGSPVLFVPDVRVVHDKGRCSRATPVRVLWHMHRGMVRYYRKFFRHLYPAPVLWIVTAGVAARFVALALAAWLRGAPPDETLPASEP
jgi:GT2 family glycosyltransferase